MSTIIDYKRENIPLIAELLRERKVGALPCDTIYGISGVTGDDTSERIYEIKERPQSKSFITLMTKEQLKESDLIVPDDIFALWPCALTAILSSPDGRAEAVRIPDDPFLMELLPLSGPIYSTSVNISGSPSLLRFNEILSTFGDKLDFIVKNENISGGKSSTLIDATKKPYRILREGSYSFKL